MSYLKVYKQTSYTRHLKSTCQLMAGDAPKSKATLVEGKEVTGNKETQAQANSSEDKTAAIYDIRKLAGLKV